MNKVVLIGRLTRDPELRYTSGNAAVCNFTIAVDRPFNSNAVEGRIQVRNYDDNNGQKRYVTEVIANSVEFMGSKNSNNGSSMPSGETSSSSEPTPYDFKDEAPQSTDVDSNPFADFGQNIEISDDELPF